MHFVSTKHLCKVAVHCDCWTSVIFTYTKKQTFNQLETSEEYDPMGFLSIQEREKEKERKTKDEAEVGRGVAT